MFATGVIEQPAVFRNNDLPGVLLASGAWRLLRRYRIAPGRHVVMVAANLEAYSVCLDLHAQGVHIAAIVDLRAVLEEGEAVAGMRVVGIPIIRGSAPYEAIAGADGTVAALAIAPLDAVGRVDPLPASRIDCDAVLMSVGWAAASQLFLQAGGTTRFSEDLQQFVPKDLPSGIFAAGRMNGVYEFEARVADGKRAGSQAAAHAGFGTQSNAHRRAQHPLPVAPLPDHRSSAAARTSSTSTRICRSRTWRTPRRKASIRANCSSATAPSAWGPRRASIRT